MKTVTETLGAIRRGLTRHCPQCGRGKLFCGYLEVMDRCAVCGHDLAKYPADDAPPYVTILIVGHILVPTALLIDRAWPVSQWVQMTGWALMAVLLTLTLLPFVKGAVVGFEWGMEIIREDLPEPLGAVPKKGP